MITYYLKFDDTVYDWLYGGIKYTVHIKASATCRVYAGRMYTANGDGYPDDEEFYIDDLEAEFWREEEGEYIEEEPTQGMLDEIVDWLYDHTDRFKEV